EGTSEDGEGESHGPPSRDPQARGPGTFQSRDRDSAQALRPYRETPRRKLVDQTRTLEPYSGRGLRGARRPALTGRFAVARSGHGLLLSGGGSPGRSGEGARPVTSGPTIIGGGSCVSISPFCSPPHS